MEISLGEAITMTARNKPDAPSFVFADGSAHTFAETNARINRLVSALRAEGVGRGDRLAVFSLDSHRYVEIVLAALKLGAVYVPLNYRLRRGEIDTLVKRAEPRIFFYDERYTGLPKGAVQSQRMMKAIVTEQIIEYRLHPGDAALNGRPELLGSIGKPAYGVALRIVDDELNDVPAGEIGEIATRGYLYLSGRKKDMIVRGGENIYPIEIESVLADHPAVARTADPGVDR